MIVKIVKIYLGLSLVLLNIVGSVHFRLVPWSDVYFLRSIGPFLWPVASKEFPSVIASVCWSLQCLVSALTQRGRWRTLFFFLFYLGSLVQPRCGEGGRDAANR